MQHPDSSTGHTCRPTEALEAERRFTSLCLFVFLAPGSRSTTSIHGGRASSPWTQGDNWLGERRKGGASCLVGRSILQQWRHVHAGRKHTKGEPRADKPVGASVYRWVRCVELAVSSITSLFESVFSLYDFGLMHACDWTRNTFYL
jgi:hypothetical protein